MITVVFFLKSITTNLNLSKTKFKFQFELSLAQYSPSLLPKIVKYCQILSNITKYFLIVKNIKQAGAELGQAQLILELILFYLN